MPENKICFISMPMRGMSEAEIEREFKELQSTFPFRENGWDFVNGMIEGHESMTPLECLAAAIEKIDKVDYVFFAPGWEEARGCRVEHMIAEEYNIPIYE